MADPMIPGPGTPPGGSVTPAARAELALATLANDAIQAGHDPHDVSTKLHQSISYLRQFPQMATQAGSALAAGAITPAEMSRRLWPHVNAVATAQHPAQPDDAGQDDPGYGSRLATHVLNTAQGIPGMEAVEAGAGALGSHATTHPMSYEQSLSTLRGQTGQIGGKTSTMEHVMGSVATLPFLPNSPVAAGAMLGGADGALDADPTLSAGERAGGAVIGAGAGALAGKVAEMVPAGVRTLLAKNPATNLLDRQAARAASASRLYSQAIAEGQGKTATPQIQQFLAEPDISEIVNELKTTRPFQGVAHDGPEMLDAVYKTLSDRAATLKKGLESVTPNRPNIGRFRMADTRAAQGSLLDAVSGGKSMPGPMPTMRDAVSDFADRSAGIDAVRQGYDALRGGVSKRMVSGSNLTRKTPEALAQWGQQASPAERSAATEGVLGGVRDAFRAAPLTLGRRALSAAPGVMRNAGSQSQALTDMLTRLGLAGANGLRGGDQEQ